MKLRIDERNQIIRDIAIAKTTIFYSRKRLNELGYMNNDQIKEMIESVVCESCACKPEDLRNNSRTRVIIEPISACMFLLRIYTSLSLSAIGSIYNKDHSTVLYHSGVMTGLVEKDGRWINLMRGMMEYIESTGVKKIGKRVV